MRIRLFAKTLLALLITTSAFAASSVEVDRSYSFGNRFAASVDPLSWTNGNFRFQFDAALNDRLSFNMPIAFGIKSAIFDNSYAGTYFSPKIGVKYFVTGKATHQGFYVNPLLGFSYTSGTALAPPATYGLTYGFRFGYAWNIAHGFWIDGYIGYEAIATNFSNGTANQLSIAPVATPGLQIGYAF